MPIGIYPLEKRKNLFKKGHKVPNEWRDSFSKKNTGRKHSKETKEKIRKASIERGAKPPSNYGKFKEVNKKIKVKSSIYISIHQWIVREKGKPMKCEHCGTTKAKRFEWANIDHKYKRNLDDYIRLCTKCHRKYDKEIF